MEKLLRKQHPNLRQRIPFVLVISENEVTKQNGWKMFFTNHKQEARNNGNTEEPRLQVCVGHFKAKK